MQALKVNDLIREVTIPNWYRLGLELTDDERCMNIIKADYPNNTSGAVEAMFNQWLKKCEKPTWQTVVSALRKIKDFRLAFEIEEKYC